MEKQQTVFEHLIYSTDKTTGALLLNTNSPLIPQFLTNAGHRSTYTNISNLHCTQSRQKIKTTFKQSKNIYTIIL